ncbi:molybdenum ABC transporter ATP-binding protein [Microvirga sp. 17 mud 1-3]|uniref:molybdenum ABC transporter ATP-binding protein n=1 Tax=Microvirga sp. 17 mud 1-3 TaxID=2082949 RepID=UPI000D6CDE9A|nr:molybdenum ABC transporter ATP-binding protein [Microvirga sp. 17 mud 1-3]AWM86402.1 molybdenum ABC transporter ATP-binding protein [Microvirga sp. 17 mud 1-3]
MSLEVDIHHGQGAFTLDARFHSEGRLTALFGRSGAGKTTLVNAIGGLVRPDRGRIVVQGRVLLDTNKGIDVPVHRRRVGYVFQEGRLFPHLTVRQNLLFGRWFTPRRERAADFDGVVELLGIGHLLGRRPGTLSGGEKQRVAIGRALLADPRILLMDEPLASLDDTRKAEIYPYIERLRDEGRVPIVLVSHSVPEIARLATSVVVLAEGRVAACGPAAEILRHPELFPEPGPAEAGALVETWVLRHEEAFDLTILESRAGSLTVPRLDLPVGAPLRVRIRARDIILALERPEGLSALNILSGTVTDVAAGEGPSLDVTLDCGGERLLARITRKSAEHLGIAPGRAVHAIVKSIAFDPQVVTRIPRGE